MTECQHFSMLKFLDGHAYYMDSIWDVTKISRILWIVGPLAISVSTQTLLHKTLHLTSDLIIHNPKEFLSFFTAWIPKNLQIFRMTYC